MNSFTSNFSARALIGTALFIAGTELTVRATDALCRLKLDPQVRAETLSQFSMQNACELRRLPRPASDVVLFYGASPTDTDIVLESMARRLEPFGLRPLKLAYPGGPYPLEMLCDLPMLESLKPAMLVLNVDFYTLDAYIHTDRLAQFDMRQLPREDVSVPAWRARRLFLRSLLSRWLVCFRYRHLLRFALFPRLYFVETDYSRLRPVERYPAEIQWPNYAPRHLAEAFFKKWERTAIPLVVWEAPWYWRHRHKHGFAAASHARLDRKFWRMMAGRYHFKFVGVDEMPYFHSWDFSEDGLHLRGGGAEAFTQYLAGNLGAPSPRR